MIKQKITWSYEHENERVVFQFNMDDMTHKEMFMMWVNFMNAIGYNLNAVEMRAMWNGE